MNLVLIGMPACGKSTVGVIAAKLLGYSFIDADLVLQQREGRLLQQIIDEDGTPALLRAEENALLSIDADSAVIATGGSAVYSAAGIEHLRENSVVAYIQVPFEDIMTRLNNLDTRGVAGAKDRSLADIYAERVPLYEKYADITLRVGHTNPFDTAKQLTELYQKYKSEIDKGTDSCHT